MPNTLGVYRDVRCARTRVTRGCSTPTARSPAGRHRDEPPALGSGPPAGAVRIRRRPVAADPRRRMAVVVIVLFNLAHFTQGWVQWGYRFSLDCLPFVLPIVALGAARTMRRPTAAAGVRADRRRRPRQPVGRHVGPAACVVANRPGPTRRRSRRGRRRSSSRSLRLPRHDAAGRSAPGTRPRSDRAAAARDDASTGFPAFVILGWLANLALAPFGEPAFRMTLLGGLPRGARRPPWPCSSSAASARGAAAGRGGARPRAHADHLAHRGSARCPRAPHCAARRRTRSGCVRWEAGGRRRPGRARGRGTRPARGPADRRPAALFGVSVANHGLTLLLVPAVAAFVLAVDRGVLRRPRLVLAALGTAVGVAALLYLELPLRAGPFPRAARVRPSRDPCRGSSTS